MNTVLRMEHTTFAAPRTLDEAEQRLRHTKKIIQELEGQQRGERAELSHVQDEKARQEQSERVSSLRSTLARLHTEVVELNAWIRKTKPANDASKPARAEKHDLRVMLWSCRRIIQRFIDAGAQPTPEEQRALERTDAAIAIDPSYLIKEARACIKPKTPSVFDYGGMIAQTTRREEDVSRLLVELRTFKRTASNVAYTRSVGDVVAALSALGRMDEAFTLMKTVPDVGMDTAYAWLAIATGAPTKDLRTQALEEARMACDMEAPDRSAKLFVKIFAASGDKEDATFAEECLLQNSGNVQSEIDLTQLARAYVRHGFRTEALRILEGLQNPHLIIETRAELLYWSKDDADMEPLRSLLRQQPPTRPGTLKRAVAAMIKHGSGARVIPVITAYDDRYLRAVGYAILARHMTEGRAKMLYAAREALGPLEELTRTEAPYILFSLACAQIANERCLDAMETILSITERSTRCEALLILYAHLRNEPLPAMLNDLL